MFLPRVLTNKTSLAGLRNSIIKECSIIPPRIGKAGQMGKESSAKLPSNLAIAQFSLDMSGIRSRPFPSGLSHPTFVSKKFVR